MTLVVDHLGKIFFEEKIDAERSGRKEEQRKSTEEGSRAVSRMFHCGPQMSQ